MAKFLLSTILMLLAALTAFPSLQIFPVNASSQNFGTCTDLPQGWTCGNGLGLPPETGTSITNGILETDLNATNTGDPNYYQYATSQKGTFPWSPCKKPATGVLPTNLTKVSSTFAPLALPTTGRYHIYIALYFWLPNGPVTAGGATHQCLDTQSRVESIAGTFSPVGSNATYDPGDSFGWDNVTLANTSVGKAYTLSANVTSYCHGDYLAWNINPSTPCQLAGVEIGVEGYQFNSLKVQWSTVSLDTPQQTTTPPNSTPSPLSSVPIVFFIPIGLLAVLLVTAAIFLRRGRQKPKIS